MKAPDTYVSLETRVSELERLVAKLCMQTSDGLPNCIHMDIMSGENAVRAIRRWRLMTQKELAEAASIGINHISRIENGASFNLRTAKGIAGALGVRIDDIS